MIAELIRFNNVQEGLRAFGNNALLMQQCLETRVDSPVLQDKTDAWQTYLDSRTMQLYGGVNQDNRQIFKIDNSPNLDLIVNADIESDGSIKISQDDYKASQGTEFVVNDGWIEFAVGKNKATPEDYAKAKKFIQKYVSEAQERNCFSDNGKGMGFYIEKTKDIKARSWCVGDSDDGSDAYGRGNFNCDGRLLGVRDSTVGEADSQKTMPYESALKEAEKLAPKGTPFNPIVVGLVNTIYQKG